MKRLRWTWAVELLAVLMAWILLCTAIARGQSCAPGRPCPPGQRCPVGQGGVNIGIGLGLGAGAWRSPRIQPAQPPQQPLAAPAPPQAVRVANRMQGHGFLGSGAFVAWGDTAVVLTCYHGFREGVGEVTVTTAQGSAMRARVLGVDPAEDLAALAVPSCPAKPLVVSTGYPRPGEVVYGGGFEGDGQWAWATGQCRGFVAINPKSKKATSFAFAAVVRQGDSGGPVLNQRGELIGVLWGTDDRETVATYSGSILRFLASLPTTGLVAAATEPPAKACNPPLPEPPKAAAICDCSPVIAKIEAMAKAWDEHRAAADKRIEAVAAAITKQGVAVTGQAVDVAEIHQAIKGLPTSIEGLAGSLKSIPGQITAVKTAVESQRGTIQSQAQIVNQVQQTVAAMPDAIGTAAAATGRTALWTALCGALGVGGPAGIGLAIGLRLLGRAINRRRTASEATTQPATATQRPPEPIVDRQIITAPVPTAHERALQAAVDLYSERYPGGGSLIQSYVSQFESGNLGALK